jgi:hypothetical protein
MTRPSFASFVAVALVVGCGDDGTTGTGAGGGASSSGGSDTGGNSGGNQAGGAGGAATSGGSGGAVIVGEPMGADCTDTCPSYQGRNYVCTFLPGFPTTLGYCSLACTGGSPDECVDTEPGEVYCNTTVGRCIIGCPFDGCPNGMECSFDFNQEPACKPVP